MTLSGIRRLLKAVHPEGIPGPGALLYSRISKTALFQATYDLLAEDILAHCQAGSILDVGTGPGALLLRLYRMQPRLQLTGLDISPAMVATARRDIRHAGLSESISIIKGSAARLPFPDGAFDAVVSTGSLHHWKEPLSALTEAHRVLRQGGHALIYDLVKDTPRSIKKELTRKYGRFRTTLFWLHTFEEPFNSSWEMELLAGSSPFGHGRVRFVSALCCLQMQKN